LADETDSNGSDIARALRLALATFAILALELSIIRWMSQQVRIFAYLNNLLLMASFLGMGLGVAAGRARPRLMHATLPSLAVLSAILAYSRELRFLRIAFPDPALSLWGAEVLREGERFAGNLAKILALFLLVVWIFVCAGSAVGPLFASMRPLRAYTADLVGSLLGVVAITAVSSLGTTPPVWFAIACLPLLVLSPRVVSAIAAVAVVLLAHRSVEGARFSPYSRLDIGYSTVVPGHPLALAANRDAHQLILDLRTEHIVDPRFTREQQRKLVTYRYMYDLPFRVPAAKRRALIVGAGTGNDVAAALRNGFGQVVSVDIDRSIVAVGRAAHPERPYSDPRTVAVIDDARAYFEQHRGERFDVIDFGLLDSHAMFSSMASLRLDNYVYTVEAMRAAWSYVADGGAMSVSFSVYAGDWISDRIFAILTAATGQQPRVFAFPESTSRTFIVTKGTTKLPAAMTPFEIRQVTDLRTTRVTTDDWPFLYLRPHTFPTGYLTVLICVLSIAAIGARLAFGSGIYGRGFDPVMFALGAAFLLIETRGVTDLSLLFGSTWIVNSSVFGGILIMALIANTIVERYRPGNLVPIFVLLLVTLTVSYFVRASLLLPMPLLTRGILGGLANGLPVGIAGIIFSRLLLRSADATASLGSNLIGAMAGGCIEYLSIATGLRFLTLIALALYAIAFAIAAHRGLLRAA
jgi:spermidine synthase